MPLFKRRNKAGTGEGPVVESNPNIAPPRKEMSPDEMIAASNKRYQEAKYGKAAAYKPVDEKGTPTEPINIVTDHDLGLVLPPIKK